MKKIKKMLALLMVAFAIVTLVPSIGEGKKVQAASYVQTGAPKTSVSFKWPAQSGATQYYIGYGLDSSSADRMAKSKSIAVGSGTTSYTIKGLAAAKRYWISIYYNKNGYVYYAAGGYGKTLCNIVSYIRVFDYSISRTSNDASCKFQWAEKPHVDGYEYEVKSNGGTVIASNKTTYSNSAYVTGLKKDVQYKIRVRAFYTINGKRVYSRWSNSYFFVPQPLVTSAVIDSNGRLTLKWNKVKSVNSYEIYISTTYGGTVGYKKVAPVNGADNTSKVLTSFDGKKFNAASKDYYILIRAVRKTSSTTYYSGTLNSTIISPIFQDR